MRKLTLLISMLFLSLGMAWAQTPVVTVSNIGEAPFQLSDKDAAEIFKLENLTVVLDVTTNASLGGRGAFFCVADPEQAVPGSFSGSNTSFMACGHVNASIAYLAAAKDGQHFSTGTIPANSTIRIAYVFDKTNNKFKSYIGDTNTGWTMDRDFGGYEIATPKMVKEDFANANIYIGGGMAGNVAHETGDATIHKVRVYNGTLTVDEIKNLDFVKKISDFKNGKVYTVSTTNRGGWSVNAALEEFCSTNDAGFGTTTSKDEQRNHFAVLKSAKDNYYLYSLAAEKFVKSDRTLAENIGEPIEFTTFSNNRSRVNFKGYSDRYINLGGSNQMAVDGWSTIDAGNNVVFLEIGEFDYEGVFNLLNVYEVLPELDAAITAADDKAAEFGDAIGLYSYTEGNYGEVLQSIKDFRSAIDENTTLEEVQEKIATLTAMPTLKVLNTPQVDKYYRLKNAVSNRYMSAKADGSVVVITDGANAASTIFYLDEDNAFYSYTQNKYLDCYNKNLSTEPKSGLFAVAWNNNPTANVITYKNNSAWVFGDRNDDASIDRGTSNPDKTGYNWVVEEVKQLPVAKIGTDYYFTLTDALSAAAAMTGDVTVEILDKVTFNQPLIGNYSSINFVGNAENAEMYLDVQGYTTATGKEVTFTDLKLSKSEGGFVANAGCMNLAFGIYDVKKVTYNNCTFLNGACASSGDVTFNGCTFYKSWDKYGLWAYGKVYVTVQGSKFADYRGIKMYSEDHVNRENAANLTVKNTDFSAADNKPAIVLTYGESVTLENNTYNADKGTFELDLDGNPNGTPVTSDVLPTCVNDNGACGVLVDGVIYTTVAQAAEVATNGSNVTLLHNSAETIVLPMGVILNKNGFESNGVTVKQPAAKIGEQGYATLSEAFDAATEDQTIVLVSDIALTEGVTVAADKVVTLDLNGKTITGTDNNTSGNFYLINNNKGNLTIVDNVGEGKITLTAVNERNWNASSVVVANNLGSVTVEGGTIEHLGGTQMAYGIDNLTNGANTVATLNIKGGTVASTYFAIRQFANNGTNNLNIEGGNVGYAWMQSPNNNANVVNINITGGEVDGLCFTGGNANVALNVVAACVGEVYGTMPAGMVLVTVDGKYTFAPAVAEVGGVKFETLAAAVDAAQAGETIELIADAEVVADETITLNGVNLSTLEGVTLTNNGTIEVKGEVSLNIETLTGEEINFLDGAIVKNSTIGGNVFVAGNVTFRGANTFAMLYDYGTLTDYYGTTAPMKWTVEEGASVTLTNAARYGLGYGDDVTVYGNIENALTARENLTDADRSLFMHGLVAQESKGWNCDSKFTVENAYIAIGSNNSFGNKSGNYGGTYTFNIKNSVVDASRITFYEASSTTTFTFDGCDVKMGTFMTRDADSKFTLKNSKVLSTTASNGTDEGNYNKGELTLENSTLTYSAEFKHEAGTINLDLNSSITAPKMSGVGTININAEGVAADVLVIKANMSGFTGAINVEGGKYEITDEGLVVKPMALEGEGTEANPFLISSVDDLVLFRNSVNAGETKYNAEGVYVALGANIDLDGIDWSVNIGDDCNATFDGIFDGKDFTISNLTSTETAKKSDGYICTGLFGAIHGNAVVKNLTIENVTIDVDAQYAGNNVSAVVGFAYACKGSIENVKVVGVNINAPKATGVGAIVGYDYYSPALKVENCIVDGANITAAAYAGGLVGYASSKIAMNNNTIEDVTVSATASVGAVAGIMLGGGSATYNTVKNVTLTANGERWANSSAVVAGTITGGAVTVSNTTVENVIANGAAARLVGGILVEQPTTDIAKVQAQIGDKFYTTLQAAATAAKENETITLIADVEATEALNINCALDLNGHSLMATVAPTALPEGYAALPNLDGKFVIGAEPTATVNNLGMTTVAAGDYAIWNGSFDSNTEDDGDMPLSFVMQFLADQTEEDMATSPFADWYGDFVLTFTGLENGSFTADNCYLAGHYGTYGWVKIPVDGMVIEDGARYPVMLGVGLGQKYDYICSSVEDFKCALYLAPEILEANPNIQVKLELGVVDNSKGQDAATEALINNENVYSVTEYTYEALDFDPSYIAEFVIDDANPVDYTFTEEKTVGTLTYKRTLIEGIWNPLYLPFEIDVEKLVENYDIAYYNQMHSYDSDNNGSFDSYEMEVAYITSGRLRANYPYFIRPKSADDCELEYVANDVILYPAVEKKIQTSSVANIFTLSGTHKAMNASELAGCYAISVDGDWSATSGLKAHRLYLKIEENDNSPFATTRAKSIRIVVAGETDGTTGIEGVEYESTEAIYDLSGRRVLETVKGGIYIVNGKKVYIK